MSVIGGQTEDTFTKAVISLQRLDALFCRRDRILARPPRGILFPCRAISSVSHYRACATNQSRQNPVVEAYVFRLDYHAWKA